MPFLVVSHTGPASGRHIDTARLPRLSPGAWQRLAPTHSVELAWDQRCVLCHGETRGSPSWWLLCEGFINRPRRFDSTAGPAALDWLGAALARSGRAALEDVSGRYALVFVDASGRLIAARDHLGGGTLYLHDSDPGRVAALATRCSLLIRPEPELCSEDPRFMAEMFALRRGHAPGSTPFAGVREVLPGARLMLEAGGWRKLRPPLEHDPSFGFRSTADWVEAFRDAFLEGVRDCIGEQGDIAVMLSGGMDSGPVLHAAAAALNAGDRRVVAVSWRLPRFPDCDESAWIARGAESAGAELVTFEGDDPLPFTTLDGAQVSNDLPYFNALRPLLLRCYRMAAENGCSIVLPGTLGDMIYPGQYLLLADLAARRHWRRLLAELSFILRRRGPGGALDDPAVRHVLSRLKRLVVARRKPEQPAWLTDDARAQDPHAWRWPPEAETYPQPDHARDLLGPAMTFGQGRENELSQRYGVERRDPFLNESLVRLMLHAPVGLSYGEGRDKWIMREAMQGIVPDALRLKPRTGVLTRYVTAGFRRNRDRIRELVLDARPGGWDRYVRARYVEDILRAEAPSGKDLVLVSLCIGYTLWRDKWRHRP